MLCQWDNMSDQRMDWGPWGMPMMVGDGDDAGILLLRMLPRCQED